MRRETIDCDVCGERIAESPTSAAKKLEDVCVRVEITVGSKHVELKDDAPIDGSGIATAVLHVCFACADEHLAGWGPFSGFTAEAPPDDVSIAPGAAVHEPKLSNVNRFLDVVVSDGAREIVVPSAAHARTASQKAPVIEWVCGSHVSVRVDGGWRDVTVIGYAVKEKLAWDAATPECAVCGMVTKLGERVTIRDAGESAYEAVCARCSAAAGTIFADKLLPAASSD
jgi:hypothetical protein